MNPVSVEQVYRHLLLVCLSIALLAGCGKPRSSGPFMALPHATSLPAYGLLELSFQHTSAYVNPFFDARLRAEFTARDGSRHTRSGFYSGNGIWTIRFRPHLAGPWSYAFRFQNASGLDRSGGGRFDATLPAEPGPLQRDPQNPHRWLFADGRPYFPLGIQDCVGLGDDPLIFTVDGEGRADNKGRRLDADQYLALFGKAGFNLLRFSQRNCSSTLMDSLDSYRETEMRTADELFQIARKHGYRVMFGFFGYHGHWYEGALPGKIWHALRVRAGAADEAVDDPGDSRTMAKEKRFIEYAIARWGEYADFWELLNERHADDRWTRALAAHVRAADPGRKPVTTSWDRPELPEIDLIAPHWYTGEKPPESDLAVVKQAAKWKRFGKPVIFGEHGNAGMNWDPTSADRLRVRLWTALFHETGLILWHTGWSKSGVFGGRYTPGGSANIYLGPQERGYTRALAGFQARLESGLQISPVRVSPPDRVRAYGLRSERQAAAYLCSVDPGNEPVSVEIALEIPAAARQAEWIDPATGRVLGAMRVPPGHHSLRTPAFSSDLALLVTAEAR
jgi:hypothetical protein